MKTIVKTMHISRKGVVGIAIAVVIAVLIVACGGDESATKTGVSVTWSPQSVTQTIKPGETKTATLTLTANKDTPSAVLRVVPEIAPYVSVSPATVGPLATGHSIQVLLTFAAKIDALPIAATGTVQLLTADANGNVLAVPLSVQITVTARDVINVPPDPGAAGTATLAGVDTDNNGIRDDIDRFLATKYGSNATSLKAGRTSARAAQRILTTDATSKSAALVALQDSGDAGICAGRDFRSAGLQASTELDEIFFRTFNTPNRVAQHKAVAGAAGLFTRNVSAAVCQ